MAKTHEQIMAESARARKTAKVDSGRWAEGTPYTPEGLEAAYESYVVRELEGGNDDYFSFETWAEEVYGIQNE